MKHIFIWASIAMYLLIVPAFTSSKCDSVLCKRVKVEIRDSAEINILDRNKVYRLLLKSDKNLIGSTICDMNTLHIEKEIAAFPEIKNAQTYTTIDGTLHVSIQQRKPVVRVMGNQIRGFYIDEDGEIIPITSGYSANVLVANGNIKANFNFPKVHNIHQFKGSQAKEHRTLIDLHKLACIIYNNSFWNAQFEQVYVTGKGEFELIPRVGAHLIMLGDVSDCESKFKNLYALYQVGFDYVSWNMYEKINLKYKNQVVCTKR